MLDAAGLMPLKRTYGMTVFANSFVNICIGSDMPESIGKTKP
jgi:hypothetical protein